MFRKCLLMLFLLFLSEIQSLTQNLPFYEISGKINGLKKGKCFLVHSLDDKMTVMDTAQIDTKGRFVFSKKKSLKKGVYAIEFQQKKRLDIIINHEQRFYIQTEFSHLTSKVRFQFSTENEAYYSYLRYVTPRHKMLRNQISQERRQEIKQELKVYQQRFFSEKKNLLATKIIEKSKLAI